MLHGSVGIRAKAYVLPKIENAEASIAPADVSAKAAAL